MDKNQVIERIVSILESVRDPEFDYNIVELGLVYEIRVDLERKHGYIAMTLTTPFCPYGDSIIGEVNRKLAEIEELEYIDLDIVFEPEWNPGFIEENPKEKLLKGGIFKERRNS
ncbi:MAG: metal-sulfur cluster assembly factor [Candidatus Micrarchaeota archaeon]|nr:metal-sulfur cluster assembly factor [Candidatus Micrarchaeota archaeon]